MGLLRTCFVPCVCRVSCVVCRVYCVVCSVLFPTDRQTDRPRRCKLLASPSASRLQDLTTRKRGQRHLTVQLLFSFAVFSFRTRQNWFPPVPVSHFPSCYNNTLLNLSGRWRREVVRRMPLFPNHNSSVKGGVSPSMTAEGGLPSTW